MTLYVELSVPASTFTVGRFLSPDDRVRVEFAHAVPLGRGEQCFWLVGDDRAAVLARFGDAGLETTVVEELPDRTLVRAEVPEIGPFTGLIADVDGVILDVTGTGEGWTVGLRVPDRGSLSAFQDACEERDIAFRLEELNGSATPAPGIDHDLSEPQSEALAAAFRAGYYDIPRRSSLSDLSGNLSASSDQAISERLRRGSAALIDATILADTQDHR